MAKKQLAKSIQELCDKHTFSAKTLLDEDRPIVTLSPRLQELSGGIEVGSLIVMSGEAKLGKTTASFHIAAKAQQQLGFTVYYENAECRLRPRDITGCHDLNLDDDKFSIIQPEIGEILYAEDYTNIAMHKLQTEDNFVLIVDSLSGMATKDLAEDDITRRYRSTVPGLMSNFTSMAASALRKKIIVILIVHDIANTGGGLYEAKKIQSGGNKIKFANNYNFQALNKSPWLEDNKIIGHITKWKCLNTVTGIGGQITETKFRYGLGFDETAELIDMCVEYGLMQQSSGYYKYNDENIARGHANVVAKLKEDKKLYNELKEQIIEYAT